MHIVQNLKVTRLEIAANFVILETPYPIKFKVDGYALKE